MTSAPTDRLWAQAQLAFDERRQPLDDEALLATLEAALDAAPDPELDAALRANLTELAALELALGELEPASSTPEPSRAPSVVGPRIARVSAAAALLLIAALLWNRNEPSAAPTQAPNSTGSAAPIVAAKSAAPQPPRATFKRLDVTIERKSAPIRLARQSLQVTTTRSLQRPR